VVSIVTKEQCCVIMMTIYCENEVLKNNNNKDLRPVSTSSGISQQVNTKHGCTENGRHKNKRKKTKRLGFSHERERVCLLCSTSGRRGKKWPWHCSASLLFMKHMGIIGSRFFFFYYYSLTEGGLYGPSPTSPNPTHSNCCTRRYKRQNLYLHVYA